MWFRIFWSLTVKKIQLIKILSRVKSAFFVPSLKLRDAPQRMSLSIFYSLLIDNRGKKKNISSYDNLSSNPPQKQFVSGFFCNVVFFSVILIHSAYVGSRFPKKKVAVDSFKRSQLKNHAVHHEKMCVICVLVEVPLLIPCVKRILNSICQ